MLIDEPSTTNALRRIVRGMASNISLQDDLQQEALIHLWLIETRRPDQTRSWYLQSCKFHLQHYMASGRSVDSAKRKHSQVECDHSADAEAEFPEPFDGENPVFAAVSTRDLLRLLSGRLSPHEQAVLICLAEGLGVREIGRRLKISHTMALRHRFKIASLLAKLDEPRPANARRYEASDNNHEPASTALTGKGKTPGGLALISRS